MAHALLTVCQQHDLQLLDRCPACGTAIAVHRVDMSNSMAVENISLSICHSCGFDLRVSRAAPPDEYDKSATALLKGVSAVAARNFAAGDMELESLEVLRHLTALMTSRYKHVHLCEFAEEQLAVKDIPLTPGRISFEERPLAERHHLIQLAAWLLADLESRLTHAWNAGVVRYNLLLKDFLSPPHWYADLASEFSNWRVRSLVY